MRIHASCVAVDGRGVLLLGRSGAGKSDLALRLIDRGALLVADDGVLLSRNGTVLTAGCPPGFEGHLEVRGVGIVRVAAAPAVPVALVVDLDAAPDRMPEPATRRLLDVEVPVAALFPHQASAPMKVELLLKDLAR